MRCFLGLDIAMKHKLAIQSWTEKALPKMEKKVPAANYHVTSLFLGEVSNHRQDGLCNDIDQLAAKPFSICFDQLSFWSKPKILCLTASQPPTAATELADELFAIAKKNEMNPQQRPYRPHISLARKVIDNVPPPLFAPSFECAFNALHLFESVSGKHGVHYPIRKTWEFAPTFNLHKNH